jgi:hypothetical protein
LGRALQAAAAVDGRGKTMPYDRFFVFVIQEKWSLGVPQIEKNLELVYNI